MTLAAAAQSLTWTFLDGDWHEGNVAVVGPRSHVMWLGSSVFDGARWFEGVAPDLDLHAARVNASAIALGLKPTMKPDEIVALTWEGLKKFDGNVTKAAQASGIGRRYFHMLLAKIEGTGTPSKS